jgi:hypothetical protein
MAGTAYWITPTHMVLPVPENHIGMVIDHPDIFGVDPEYIRKVYAHHQEPMRSEGDAREEIIKELIAKGFIRLRRYVEKYFEYWSVNVRRLDESTMNILKEFFWKITKGYFGSREKDSFAAIRVDTVEGSKSYILNDLIQGHHPDKPGLTLWRQNEGDFR